MSFWKCMKKTPFFYDQQASHAKMPLSPDAFSKDIRHYASKILFFGNVSKKREIYIQE